MTEAAPSGPEGFRWPLLGYALATCLAVFTYFYGLDSDHIPKNGDEFVYLKIARLTALGGHWLPLEAGDDQMRNTKPPLLFWQGIIATDWGRDWTLWRLRCPSVVYTLLTGLLVYLLGAKLSGRRETGFLGLLAVIGLGVLLGIGFAGFTVSAALGSGNAAATQGASFLFFPLTFLAPTFVPLALLSGWLEVAAKLNPITYVLEAMRALLNTGWDGKAIGASLLACLALAVAMYALAAFALHVRTRRL